MSSLIGIPFDPQVETQVRPLQRQAMAAALVLVALLVCVPFLSPFHRYPITTFDSEWIAAVTLAIAMIVAALASRVRVGLTWPLPSIAIGLLAIGTVHYLSGTL